MNGSKIPPPILPRAFTQNATIGELHFRFQKGGQYTNPNLPEGTRFVAGFPLPFFQRELVWTETQKVRFIESVWNNFHLGIYIVNEVPGINCYSHPLHEALIDGQQRLHALECYWSNQFKVFGHTWDELPATDQRHFRNKGFARAVMPIEDEPTLRLAYNLLNFGGVPHTENQRA